MKKYRVKKKVGRKIVGILCLGLSIVLVISISEKVISYVNLNNQKELVEKELALLQEENDKLSQTKSKLEDPNYVQTYARGEYMFSKSDEKVFYLPSSGD